MKKTQLLNADLSYIVASMGHNDELVVCDAGLPIADHVQKVDLALKRGVPEFIETCRTLLSELQIESIIIASELETESPEMYEHLMALLKQEEVMSKRIIPVQKISHDEFKQRSEDSKAIIRTGEFTPYANVIFRGGVTF